MTAFAPEIHRQQVLDSVDDYFRACYELPSFQVEDEESRKVYQSSGALMHHFDDLSPTQRAGLLSEGEGADHDRLISRLWANLSEGRCRFVMVKDKRWEWIEEQLK